MVKELFADVFASRIKDIPRSFLREILKVAKEPGMISFAGGLPNKDLFPVDALRDACDRTLTTYGSEALQYSNSEGELPLREYIAHRYAERGVRGVKAQNVLITCGSQQALDLLGKVLINEGDRIVIEEPSYLGAIQALSMYQPSFAMACLSSCKPLLSTGT